MLRAVNRVLLALLGLLLLVLGAAVLIAGLNLRHRWGFSLGSWFPFGGRHDVLLSRADRTRWRHHDWWWPAVFGALALLVVFAAWWLLEQLHRHRVGAVLVETGDGEGAWLKGSALESVLEDEAAALDGVGRARVHLRGHRTAPHARMELALEPHGEPGTVLARLRGEVLEHARQSAGLDQLPAEARLRAVRHRAERVS